MAGTLLVVHVDCRVRPEHVEAFEEATLANAKESAKEPGIARFDVVQDREDPASFVLVEIYRSAEALAAHKATPHYATWRDTVAPMMAEPRSSRKFVNLHPADAGFG